MIGGREGRSPCATPTSTPPTSAIPASRSTCRRPATAAPGCCAATTATGTEFITYSLWDSLDAIRGFAGDDIEAAVYYPEDERFLIEQDDRVKHYEIVAGPERAARR